MNLLTKLKQRTETYHEYAGPLLIDENELFVTYSMNMNDVKCQKLKLESKVNDANVDNIRSESFLPFTLEVLPNDPT